ncbi:hypothetical protein NUU61_009098 [Penicillium alfredii]|uniref:Uncharacterized protein n=1 Tax=Penicillium alfredii TaxID=1506179 RepID=A0A9W9EMP5_9EURO|nr:uncharacterized protein NUU61_009098 [Penicillium alfredii]KAJ5084519.1 hypothetical protein NUU61_009098 [Penicillium alfredii]
MNLAADAAATALSGLEKALGRGAKLRDAVLWGSLGIVLIVVPLLVLCCGCVWALNKYTPTEPLRSPETPEERSFWLRARRFRRRAPPTPSTELGTLSTSSQPAPPPPRASPLPASGSAADWSCGEAMRVQAPLGTYPSTPCLRKRIL